MATVTVTVSAENDPPLANDDGYSTSEDTPLIVSALLGVLGNDSDPEGDLLTAVEDTAPLAGELTLNGDGSFSYTPTLDYSGVVSFTYHAWDGAADSNVATVTLTVTAVNDPPVAQDDAYTTTEDSPLSVPAPGVLDNDTDPDASDTLSVLALDDTGTLGQVTSNGDGTFNYDPNAQFEYLAAGEQATDAFAYTVSDGNGGTDSATVTIAIDGVNDAPDAVNDAGDDFTTDEDTLFTTGNVLTTDTDPDANDTLSVLTFYTTGTLGLVTDNRDGTFDYGPNRQFRWLGVGKQATDAFFYTVSDENGGTDSATVTITITGVNDAPDAVNDAGVGFATDEDTPFTTGNVLGNDTDPDAGDELSVSTFDTTGTAGLVTSNGDGTFDYDPNAQFEWLGVGEQTTDAFGYTVSDGNGGTDTATVTIAVNGINDEPDASQDSAQVYEDSVGNDLGVLGNDTDPDGDTLMIAAVTQGSHGTVVITGGGTGLTYTPDPDYYGPDTFTYTISDGNGGTDTTRVDVVVTSVNDAPVADAGSDQNVDTNATVTLDGSGSDDPDGNLPLSYVWRQVGGSPVSLSDPNASSPSFAAPSDPTELVFTLLVLDSLGLADITPDSVVVTVHNRPPVADAGLDQDADTNAVVTLDGSGSDDPDGDLPLSYGWVQAGGPAVSLSDPTAESPTFAAPGDPVVLTFELVVTDSLGLADSTPDNVVIAVGNRIPVADAGLDRGVDTNATVVLDGSGSHDPDGDLPLTFGWTQIGGPTAILSDPTAESPTFAAPGDPAVLTFELVVTDSLDFADPTPDEVVITVRNQAPIADAGLDQNVDTNATVTLDGSGSHDPDGDLPLSFGWTQTGGLPIILSDPTAESPTFTAPDNPGVLTFQLVVIDSLDFADPTPDEVVITVGNQAPIADAGLDQNVDTNATVTLDGSGSHDPDGDLPLSFGWTQTGGLPIILSDPTAESPTFTAPDNPGVLTFELVVTDSLNFADPTPDEVVVTVHNRAPVADAGLDQSVKTNALVVLEGSGSGDPDGDLPLTYRWIQTGGPSVTLSDSAARSPAFASPGHPTVLTFQLVVTDSFGLTSHAADEVVVTVSEYQVYVPAIFVRSAFAPDLVVRTVNATSNEVKVVIENQGKTSVQNEFWVDVYISPRSAPTVVNQTWEQLGTQGLAWAVLASALPELVPGGVLTLTVGGPYYAVEYSSVSWPLPAGTVLYAQVDSFNPDTAYGAVLETHEIIGQPYNNISGPFLSTFGVKGELSEPRPSDVSVRSRELLGRPPIRETP